jgi:hypothetical protein
MLQYEETHAFNKKIMRQICYKRKTKNKGTLPRGKCIMEYQDHKEWLKS